MRVLYLAMYGEKLSILEALFISVFAMMVVFIVLLTISYLIDITAFLLNKKKKNSINENINTIDTSPVAIDNVSDSQLVAVISAAIASYLGTSNDNIRIKKIRRVNQNHSAWAESALLNNKNCN